MEGAILTGANLSQAILPSGWQKSSRLTERVGKIKTMPNIKPSLKTSFSF
ncbi:MAG: hypothetical protein U0401_01610 [Anaerolineae bacterium]